MSSDLGRRGRARPPAVAEDPANKVAQLEQLLAHHIGPMAKVVIARASKKARGDDELLNILAETIDVESERAAFVKAAARVIKSLSKTEPARAAAQDTPAAAAAESAHAPPGNSLADAPGSDIERESERNTAPASESPSTPPALAPAVSVPTPPGAVEPDAPNVRERTSDATIAVRSPDAPVGESGSTKAGAIFVSYARGDRAVAQRVTDALRAAGLEVWLDLGKLQPGDAWDLKIRRSIEACSFFVALVSRETEARQEGYFRREWNIAADRALNFADDVPFILPVTIDGTPAYTARVPERFRRAHWISLPDGEVTSELVDCLKQLVDDSRGISR